MGSAGGGGVVVGTTSQRLQIFVQDSSKTTGVGLTGLVFNSAGLIAYYMRDGDSSATAITLATATVGTWATGGFKEVDATHMPGVYEFDPPNACFASGSGRVTIMLSGATNMAPVLLGINLTAPSAVSSEIIRSGTAQAGAATTITLDSGASAVDNTYQYDAVTITGGTGVGQSRVITSYVGSTKVATVNQSWTTNPDSTSTFIVTPTALANSYFSNVTQWLGTAVAGSIPPDVVFARSGTAQAGGVSTITLDSGASATDDFYENQIIILRGGTGAGQSAIIASYVGSTKVATIAGTWATNPDNTTTFTLIAFGEVGATVIGGVNVTQWLGTSVTAATAGIPDVNVKNYNNHTAVTDTNNFPSVNVADSAGVTVYNANGTIASATSSTVTFPTTDSAGNSIPDNTQYKYIAIQIVAGTGVGQIVLLTTSTGTARQYNVLSGTMPVQLDSTSQYVLLDTWRTEGEIRTGAAQAGGASTITLDSGASATNNFYQNQVVVLVSGTGAGQSAIITSYVGSTKVATIVGSWATNPDNTTTFTILAFGSVTATVSGGVNVTQWLGTGVAASVAGIPNVNVVESAGVTVFDSDGTLSGATSSTVTLPATDSAGNNIPDQQQYQYCALEIVGGTGIGQVVLLTTGTGTAHQYNILSGTMPTPCDSTSQYLIAGSWQSELTSIVGSTVAASRLESLFSAARQGTVDSSTFTPTTTQFQTSFTVNQDNYTSNAVYWVTGTNAGMTVDINTYTFDVINTKVRLTTSAMPVAPSNGDIFLVFGRIGA